MERGKRRRMRRNSVRGVRGGSVGVRVIEMAGMGIGWGGNEREI
jgi:hypothetical protein